MNKKLLKSLGDKDLILECCTHYYWFITTINKGSEKAFKKCQEELLKRIDKK